MAVSPSNTSAALIVDGATTSSTINAGFTFTASRTGIALISHYNDSSNRLTSVSIGGSAATMRARAAAGNFSFEIWDVLSMTGGSTSLALSYGAGGNYVSAGVIEFASGVITGYDTGTGNNATATSTAPAVSTATTTSQASTLIVAGATTVGVAANVGLGGPAGWNIIFTEQDSSAHQPGRGGWLEETSAGTKTATFSQANNETWYAAIAAYRLAASGGSSSIAAISSNRLRFQNN